MDSNIYNERGNEWIFKSYPGLLGVQKNGVKKFVKVEDCCEFTFQLMKTKIKAAGGSEGLQRFMERCIKDNFCTAYVEKILNYAADVMKPASV